MAATRDDHIGDTYNGDRSACPPVSHSSVAVARDDQFGDTNIRDQPACPPVFHNGVVVANRVSAQGPNSTAHARSLVSSSSRRSDRSRPPVSVVSASSVAANREPNVQSGTSVPTWRVTSSSARGTATNSPGQSQRVSRQTALSVPRERHSTPPPRNSRQSAIRALAGDVRDTAGAIVRLLAPHRPRRSSRPPNRVPRGLVNRSSTIDRLAWTCCQCVVCAFLQHLALCFSSPFLLCFFRAFCFAALAIIPVRPTHVEEPFLRPRTDDP